MNKSERLLNQGNNEQAMTPELRLSIELRTTCENLLREKGRNSFSFGRIFYRTFFNSADMADGVDSSVEKVRYRRLVLKGGGDKEQNRILLACTGTNPEKAKFVEIYFLSEPNARGRRNLASKEWLRLEKNKKGVAMNVEKPVGIVSSLPIGVATVEDLSYYQKLVGESSPIEHK